MSCGRPISAGAPAGAGELHRVGVRVPRAPSALMRSPRRTRRWSAAQVRYGRQFPEIAVRSWSGPYCSVISAASLRSGPAGRRGDLRRGRRPVRRRRRRVLDLLDLTHGVLRFQERSCAPSSSPSRAARATACRYSVLRQGSSVSIRSRASGAGNAPPAPWRSTRSSRMPRAAVLPVRWVSTAQQAASYGEWKPHGRSPGRRAWIRPITESRSPTAGQPRASTSRRGSGGPAPRRRPERRPP